jgi:lipopolysaccharide export LptBFGC system permease protein LptF
MGNIISREITIIEIINNRGIFKIIIIKNFNNNNFNKMKKVRDLEWTQSNKNF